MNRAGGEAGVSPALTLGAAGREEPTSASVTTVNATILLLMQHLAMLDVSDSRVGQGTGFSVRPATLSRAPGLQMQVDRRPG